VTAKNGCAIHISIDDLKAAIRDTKPSAIKSLTVEIPQVHWSSIGGMEYVKRELREAVELPLTHGELFHQLRVPPPRGILLYGALLSLLYVRHVSTFTRLERF
jgi:SpoVK/Ycf46/Vps4 family AAA+-type ATPase